MSFRKIILLLCASGLAHASPQGLRHRDVNDLEIDVNTFKENIGKAPEECTDFLNPSRACLEAIKSSIEDQGDDFVGIAGGRLQYGCCTGCDDSHVSAIATAALGAYTLSYFAKDDPSMAATKQIWETWMGPNYLDFQGRALGQRQPLVMMYRHGANLLCRQSRRVAEYQHNGKYDIYMNCNDQKRLCGNIIGGKPVGGYAWSYTGWFGYQYYYINLCPVFFRLDSLDQKLQEIQDRLKGGDESWARQADWQKNMGQFFLHEVMHLDGTSKGRPHINDEYVSKEGIGPKAYGPKLVYKLAQLKVSSGGGAERATTNADSYAWLANSMYFFKTLNRYPLPPNYKSTSDEVESDDLGDDGPFMLDLGAFSTDEHVTDDAFNARVDEAIKSFGIESDHGDGGGGDDDDEDNAAECRMEGTTFTEDEANKAIDNFCDAFGRWSNTLVVPPISIGTGATKDGRNKALGAYSNGDTVEGSDSDKLWVGVTFANKGCLGFFSIGADGAKDVAECKRNLRAIRGKCGEKSGQIQNSCDVWYMKTGEENPMDRWWEDRGELQCGDTCSDDKCREILSDDDLANSCKCWFANYDTVTEVYARPDSGKCDADDVDRAYNYYGH